MLWVFNLMKEDRKQKSVRMETVDTVPIKAQDLLGIMAPALLPSKLDSRESFRVYNLQGC